MNFFDPVWLGIVLSTTKVSSLGCSLIASTTVPVPEVLNGLAKLLISPMVLVLPSSAVPAPVPKPGKSVLAVFAATAEFDDTALSKSLIVVAT